MESEMKTIEKGDLNIEGESIEDHRKWVYDSSVDYKGKVPHRSKTGVWKASLFIIAIEFSERLSYFGIATNLITYLTRVMHQDMNIAAKNVNYWAGVTTIMPLIGGFLADSYTGRFAMVLLSSIFYLLGLILLTMSQYIPSLSPCPSSDTCEESTRIHKVVFFLALYMLSVGTGGHKPCLESFGADQFDDNHDTERVQKMSFFNWWNFALCCGLFLGVTLIVYIQDDISWGLAYGVITATMAATVVIFIAGRPRYRYRVPQGSPFTPMLQVLVAAFRKRKLHSPSHPSLLHQLTNDFSRNLQGRILGHTDRLRFLDKAAIIEAYDKINNEEEKISPWRLRSVTRVEEVKLIVSTIPVWLTSLIFGLCLSQPSTFFVKQAAVTDRKILPNFTIPPASVYGFGAVAMIATVAAYDRVLVPLLRRSTGDERGLGILRRIGLGMAVSTASMAVAAVVESKRRREIPPEIMSVYWLVPQFVMFGVADGFTLVGLQEYFYDQVPDSMRSLGIALYLSVIGVGSFLGSFLIYVVDGLAVRFGSSGWIGKDLRSSRLDYFYWLLAVMSALNLGAFVAVARRYTYKNVERRDYGYDVTITSDKVSEVI